MADPFAMASRRGSFTPGSRTVTDLTERAVVLLALELAGVSRYRMVLALELCIPCQ